MRKHFFKSAFIAAGIGAFFAFQLPVFSETSSVGCGDGICDEFEQAHPDACPGDCKTRCVGQGGSIPVVPSAPSCCAGLMLIGPKDPNILGSKGICTSRCGNGICDPVTETVSNCPKDCKSTAYRDVPFGFHTGNAFPKDITAHNPNNPLDPEIWGKYGYAQDIGAGWERPGMYAWIPPHPSGVSWPELTDRIYGTIPSSMRIFANIDVRAFTHTRPSSEPEETKNLTTYHPPASSLELFDEKMFLQFVKDLVERYDGDGISDMPGLKNPVHYWQLDNELPGMPPFDVNSMDQSEKDNWLQTSINNYVHIVEITSKAIKSSDPSAKVAIAGVADFPGVGRILRLYYMEVLKRVSRNSIDILDYHFYGNAGNSWKAMEDEYRMIRRDLDSIGYTNLEIWITETGTYTGSPRDIQGRAPIQTEKEQAVDLVRRMVYPVSFGVKKVFWAWGIMDCAASEGPDGSMGLMYNGKGPGNPGYGVKKLSYYAYKKLIEVLEGSDWNTIRTVRNELNDSYGIFLFQFTRNAKPVYVGWFHCFNEQKCGRMKIDPRVEIRADRGSQITITKAVPRYESGKDVVYYKAAFETETKKTADGKVFIVLGEVPVYVEIP
jgi:hypothetical protein